MQSIDKHRLAVAVIAAAALTACASRYEPPAEKGGLPQLRLQNSVIAPGQGGELIAASVLEPADVLLSSGATLQSLGIQLATLAPVSHALVYLGDGLVAEAVGEGVRTRRIEAVLDEEAMVVAFRAPDITPAQAQRLRDWSLSQVGVQYNTVGVMLTAPFVLSRRLCELPLVPGAVRDACVRGFATVQLGASRDDRFFCSQFVLEAYRQAGAPLSSADPRWVTPADLLHMREGDVATLTASHPLQYVGHLKVLPPLAERVSAP